MSRRAPRGGPSPEWPAEPDGGYGYDGENGALRRGQPGPYNGQYDQYNGQRNGQYGQPNGQFSQQQQRNGQPPQRNGQLPQRNGQPAQRNGQPPQRNGQPPQRNGQPPQRNGQYGQRNGQPPQRNGQHGQHGGRYGQQGGQESQPTQTFNYQGAGTAYRGSGDTRRYGDTRGPQDGRAHGNMRRYEDPQQLNGRGRQAAGLGPGAAERPRRPRRDGGPGGPGGPGRKVRKLRFRRIRKLMRYRSARVVSAILALFLVWGMFSAGQATFTNNGQSAVANLAEWFRDHHMGALVTLGEYLSYNPPKVGGKPTFSLSVPKGEAVTPGKAPTTKAKNVFVPDIPAPLKALAGPPMSGEGQWRVVEKVDGQPAIFTTFLRDATYTSYVNGIASIDPRLVQFQLHPGSEDPGPGNWGPWGSDYIQQGARTGLVATFNSGFKLNAAGGGFYLNGRYHGSLVNGAASIVYYKNGMIKIGSWGSEVSMSSQVEAVRQNLKLLIDHGKLAPDLNQNIESSWGATLGGGYYVWRSGLGITKDGRIVYAYGPALNVKDLATLLQRAGAVEAMQLDINPYWMKFEYYTIGKSPSDPKPTNLLPTQQQSAYSYYSPYTRDFTAVYARSKPYVK